MKRSCLIGCGAILALAVIAIISALEFAPEWFARNKGWFSRVLAEEQAISAMSATWTAPSATPDATWCPPAVGDWRLEKSEPIASIPLLQLDREGQHAIYLGSREAVEVRIVAATDLEKEALFDRAKTAFNARSGGKLSTSATNRLYLRLNGREHTRLWWIKGWLFVFQSTGAEDPWPFAEVFVRTIDESQSPALER